MKAVSLFSGAGGLDVGFEKAGYQIVWANDFNKNACDTYNLNHTTKINHGDIRNYYDELSGLQDIDVVFGGPPCQGFSVAGKMDPDDERSKLLFSFFDVVERVKPRFFILENVKALGTLEKWSSTRDAMIAKAHELGFKHVELIILNASEYGVPQKRERMFLIGTNEEHPSSKDSIEEIIKSKKVTAPPIKNYFKNLGRAGTEGNSGICAAKITLAKKPVLRASPYAGMMFNGAGRPIDANGYSNTLTASMGGSRTPIIDEDEIFEGKTSWIKTMHDALRNGDSITNFTVPPSLRRITIQEAAMIQTFPDNYKFAGPQSAIYKQIGNAVPCELAYVVASSLSEYLR